MGHEPLWRRYRRFWRPDPRQDVDDELAFHLAMREDEYRREGHTPDAAHDQAVKRFGDVERIRDECHELGRKRVARRHRAFRWEALRQDVRYALRSIRTNPGFALAVVVTMALGIGATSAVFSVAYGALLRPLPYRDADALVRLWSMRADRGLDFFSVSPADYRDWKAQTRAFAAMGAFERQREAALTLGGEPQGVELAAVTPDIFALLGTPPALGRSITPDDAAGAANPVVLLSDDAWTTRFGADPSAVGRDVTIDGRPHRIVGVMPPGFYVPGTSAELWTPLSLAGAPEDHSNRYLRVLARLAPSASLDRARRELDLVSTRLGREYPATNAGWGVNTMSVPEMIVGAQFRRAVLVLLGVVGFVLLIACANAANLQLARAAARRREMAVRCALGASRGRILAQLLAESAVLGAVAGVAGLALAYGGVALLRALGAETVPRLEDVRLDAPVLAFTLVLALGSGVLFGLAPALRAARSDHAESLKQGARGSSGLAGDGVRSALVVAEVMLSLILLIGAGLLTRTFVRLQNVDTGFDARGVIALPLRLPEASYPDTARATAFYDALLEQAAALPGVTRAAAVSSAPFAGPNSGLVFARADQAPPDRQEAPDADYRVVTPGYLATLGVPLLRGRDLSPRDARDAPPVAVISQAMARTYWPGEDPVGGRVRIGDVLEGPVFTIVGVAGDARYQSLETPDARPMIYFSLGQRPQHSMTLVLRTTNPAAAAAGVRRAVASLDATLALAPVEELSGLIRRAFATRRFALALFGIFAAVAAVLAGVGIYGVLSFLVRQRTRELGIRVALGAPRGRLMATVVGRALRLTTAGVVLGLLGAWYLSRSLGALLFETSATDRGTFAGVAALVLAIGGVASLVPARRAMRADPMEALRAET